MLSNRTLTPVAGPLRVTTPLRAKPLTQIFPLGTHNPISTLAPDFTGLAVSTRHPPALVFDRFPQMGVGASSTRNSTATKHLMRGCFRRSLPHVGANRSGSKGGVADTGVGTSWDGCTGTAAAVFPASAAAPDLISRMAFNSASSRFSTGA